MPDPITLSVAEAEVSSLAVGLMAAAHSKMIIQELVHGDSAAPFTMPVFMDSEGAICMSRNEKGTRRNRHIA
jgi:hypothetical protein